MYFCVQVSTLGGDSLPCVLVAAKEELVMGAELEGLLRATLADLQVRGCGRLCVCVCVCAHMWMSL